MAAINSGYPPPLDDRIELRRWWHKILSQNEHLFKSYAFFLILPSDEIATSYIATNYDELNQISGDNCLIIIINSGYIITEDQRWELKYEQKATDNILKMLWGKMVKNYVSQGYSAKLARYFDIKYTDFPCMIFFRDIRSTQHVLITLKDLDSGEITQKLRWVFSTLDAAIKQGHDPLQGIIAQQQADMLQKKGKSIIRGLRDFAGKTIETAMDAVIKAQF